MDREKPAPFIPLAEAFPKLPVSKVFLGFSLQLVYFGRAVCRARKPDCDVCPLTDKCQYFTSAP